ncbi:hypothetical protein EDD15DRAFT_2376609 [Pisolithus albus]|nr:hypothetical protein EDD15DRAFT_2376609 [Pisolithus albus]
MDGTTHRVSPTNMTPLDGITFGSTYARGQSKCKKRSLHATSTISPLGLPAIMNSFSPTRAPWILAERWLSPSMQGWHQSSRRLFDIVFIASVASTTFKRYNLYVRQCYLYARITLDAMAKAFPSCSRQGTTSFSKGWFAILGSYKLSQVQLLVDLHAIGSQAIAPAIETERRVSRLVTPDFLHGLAVSIASFQRSLVRLMSLEPGADTATRHATTRQEQ